MLTQLAILPCVIFSQDAEPWPQVKNSHGEMRDAFYSGRVCNLMDTFKSVRYQATKNYLEGLAADDGDVNDAVENAQCTRSQDANPMPSRSG